MRPPARHALLVLAFFPLATLFAETASLPPALAALRAKAESGNSIAQYNLGLAYAQGREVLADPVEAFIWLNLAAESGTAGKAYDQLLQEITPAQLAEAKRRLALRKNSSPASPVVLAPFDSPISLDSPAPSNPSSDLAAKNQLLTGELIATRARLDAANAAAGRATISAKAEANTIVDSLNAKLTSLDAQLTVAKSTAAQAAEFSRAELAQQKRTLGETIANLTAEKNTLAERLAQATAAKPDAAAPKIAALETEVSRASQHAAALQAQIDELTADRAILKQKLAEGGRAPATKSDDSSAQISALQAQVAALTAAKSPPAPATSAELTGIQAKLETALRSFTLAQNENAALKTAAETAAAGTASLRQQLADAQNKTAAPATDDPSELKRQLTDTETKLTVALRSYTVLSAENDQLKAAAAGRADSSRQALAATEARAATSVSAQAAQLAEVRDQLRQVQAQSAAYAEENFQLRTRLASGDSGPAPTRTTETLVVSPVPAKALVTPTPAPTTEPAARTHTIVTGDTLQGLAKKYYGDASRWNEILTANRDVLGAKQTLVIGRKLRIP